MRLALIITLIALGTTLYGQDQDKGLNRNSISFETGIWSRGLAGVSYSRNFFVKDKMHLSSDASAGIGVNARSGDMNLFINLNPMLNFGRNSRFFMIGVKGVYSIYNSASSTFATYGPPEKSRHEGYCIAPVLGYSEYYKSGLVVKFRGSAFAFDDMKQWRPSLGVSFGYSF